MRAYITAFPEADGPAGLRLEVQPMDTYATIRIGYEGEKPLTADAVTFFVDNGRLAHTWQAFTEAADRIAVILRAGHPDSDIKPGDCRHDCRQCGESPADCAETS